MGNRDNCSFRHRRVDHQCRLDLCCAYAVTGDVDDIVHTACDPVEPVLVALCPVTGEVVPLEHREVYIHEPLMVACYCPQYGGPGAADGQNTRALPLEHVSVVVHDSWLHAKEGEPCSSGAHWACRTNAAEHVSASLCLPPGVGNRAAVLANNLEVPSPDLGVDWLADTAKQADGAPVVAGHPAVIHGHQGTEHSWSSVENCHLVPCHCLPQPASIWKGWDSLEAQCGRSI
mmetsp:Transcript_25334/g.70865  ORF Transcript_25334/g.70865 Transcript_25334/m.70865 type:complete len:231 (-) Transcript_25334:300-992(-)